MHAEVLPPSPLSDPLKRAVHLKFPFISLLSKEAFETTMAELNTLVGDRMEGLAAHHLPVQNLSYPSLEMFTPQQRYWQGWVKSCGAAMDLLPSFQEADLIA